MVQTQYRWCLQKGISRYRGSLQKLLALQAGVKLATDNGYYPIEVETDSTKVIQTLSTNHETFNDVIHSCRLLMPQKEEEMVIRHNFRQGNMVAHMLAKEA